MNINRVAIDTMGKADDPSIDAGIERDEFREAAMHDLVYSGDLLALLTKHLNDDEFIRLEDALLDIYRTQPMSDICNLLAEVIEAEAIEQTQVKFGD